MVGGVEVKAVGPRVNGFPLEHVFGTDGIELRRDDRHVAGISFLELAWVYRRADAENSLESVFQRGWLGVHHAGRQQGKLQ